MSRVNKKIDRVDRDYYVTPYWTIQGLNEKLLENWKFWDNGYPEHIIDAGSGDSRIGSRVGNMLNGETGIKIKRTYVDLDPLIKNETPGDFTKIYFFTGDFLTWQYPINERVLIVSNPPFSLSLGFCKRFIEILDKSKPGSFACVLLPLTWLGTKTRYPFLKENPPKSVFVLSCPRPSFTGNGKTNSVEYAWFIWTKDNIHIDPFQFINKYDLQQK